MSFRFISCTAVKKIIRSERGKLVDEPMYVSMKQSLVTDTYAMINQTSAGHVAKDNI